MYCKKFVIKIYSTFYLMIHIIYHKCYVFVYICFFLSLQVIFFSRPYLLNWVITIQKRNSGRTCPPNLASILKPKNAPNSWVLLCKWNINRTTTPSENQHKGLLRYSSNGMYEAHTYACLQGEGSPLSKFHALLSDSSQQLQQHRKHLWAASVVCRTRKESQLISIPLKKN